MSYEIEIKAEAKAALKGLPEDVRREIGYRLHLLQQEFSGDVKNSGAAGTNTGYASAAIAFYLNWSANASWFMLWVNRKTSTDEYDRRQNQKPFLGLPDVDRQIRNAKIVLRELRVTLEDLDDRRELARAKKRNAGKPGTDWESVKKEFGFNF